MVREVLSVTERVSKLTAVMISSIASLKMDSDRNEETELENGMDLLHQEDHLTV